MASLPINVVIFQHCSDYFPEAECYMESCQKLSRPVLTKECHQVMEEECQVVVDQVWEDQCTQVEVTEYREECGERETEECTETSEWVCEDQDALFNLLGRHVWHPNTGIEFVPQLAS